MNLGNLWSWFVTNVLEWIVIFACVFGTFHFFKRQEIGKVVGLILLGAFLWFFIKNPQTVLDALGNAAGQVFNAGSGE